MDLDYYQLELIRTIAAQLEIGDPQVMSYNELCSSMEQAHPQVLTLYERYIEALLRFDKEVIEKGGTLPSWHNERQEAREELVAAIKKILKFS